MKLTGLGKMVILILAAGLALGGWRVWQQTNGGKGGSNGPIVVKNNGGQSNGGESNNGGSNNGADTANAASSDILLVTSASKKGWLQDQIARFNAQNGSKYRITTQFLETREAMTAILGGNVRPVIYCPSSSIWTQRLQSAWAQKNGGQNILNVDDPNSYRIFLRTPLVFVTTRTKAKFLRPLLGRPGGWQAMRDLGLRRRRPPWGNWKWSHANPLTANSGMMTLGAIMADFSGQSGQSDYVSLVKSAAFRTYLRDIERGLVYDLPAESGSSPLFKAFTDDLNRYDAITTYESNALEVAQSQPQLAVIYPNPTVVSEHTVAILNGAWASENQKEGARSFVQFLGTPQSLRAGVAGKFRPAQGNSSELNAELNRLRDRGFQSGFTSVELPPYEALNEAAYKWSTTIKRGG